jgi:NADH-quinone oxidoreductase subunit N
MRDLLLIAPELILTVCACVALVMEVVLPYRKSKWTAYFALGSVLLAAASLTALYYANQDLFPLDGFYGMVRIDGFAVLFKGIFLIGAALTIAISIRFLDIEGEQHGEYYALVLFATVGMMFLACGYDLISLYISLELMALTFYVLVAFTKREKRSNEAAMKYFLLGAFSSGILLYGMSMLYGVAGSTNLGEISVSLAKAIQPSVNELGITIDSAIPLRPLILLGMIALAAGLFFKISAVPFHMWAPDAYEGAPHARHGLSLDRVKGRELCPLRAHLRRRPGAFARHRHGLGSAPRVGRGRHYPGGQLGRRHAGEL